MKTIGVVGSRRRNSHADYLEVLAAVNAVYEVGDRLVSGGCPQGGDHFAEVIAKKLQCSITIHYAAWDRLGKGAGFARNTTIAVDADVLVACVAPDRKGGTEDTIKKFKKLGKTDLLLV